MDSTSAIPPDMVQAYRETLYRVFQPIEDGPPAFTLQVGLPSVDLAELHRQHQATCSAFITPCNPLSCQLSSAQNQALLETLIQEVSAKGWHYLAGAGQHPSNNWPAEPSLLVLGISRDAACEIGNLFEQNAIVWSGDDAVPQLVLLR